MKKTWRANDTKSASKLFPSKIPNTNKTLLLLLLLHASRYRYSKHGAFGKDQAQTKHCCCIRRGIGPLKTRYLGWSLLMVSVMPFRSTTAEKLLATRDKTCRPTAPHQTKPNHNTPEQESQRKQNNNDANDVKGNMRWYKFKNCVTALSASSFPQLSAQSYFHSLLLRPR